MDSGDRQVIPLESVRLHTETACTHLNQMDVRPVLALTLASRIISINCRVWSWGNRHLPKRSDRPSDSCALGISTEGLKDNYQ
jgi:hypothetical protein